MPTKPAYGTPLNTASSLYNGVVCRYLLNDGSGTTPDDSGPNALHLTAINSPTWVTGSDGSMALLFGASGNQVLRCPSGVNAGVSGQSSFLYRIKPSTITPSPAGILFADWSGASTNLYIEVFSGKIKLTMGNGVSGSSSYTSTSSISAAGNVQNIIVLRNGSGYEIYHDGSLIGGIATTNLGGLTSNTIGLGNNPTSDFGYGFRGVMEQIAFWNRNLTSAEISALQADPYSGYVSASPTIIDLSPDSGAFGTAVILSGTNLHTVTNLTLNGQAVVFRIDSSSQITAVVDSSATSGIFEATNAVGTGESTFFSVVGGGGGIPRPSLGWQWPLDH